MFFQPLTFATGISLVLLSRVQALPSPYVNTSTPVSTPVVTDEPTALTPPNLSTWVPPTSLPNPSPSSPPDVTVQNTTSSEGLPSSTVLPTSTPALLNSTSSYVYPNATVTQSVYNTSSTIPHAFNTTTPTPIYTNTTATKSSWFTYAQNTTGPSGPTPAPVKLSPALPPSLDAQDPVILQPNRSVSLYFQAPPRSNSSEIPMASVDIPKMAYPAVVLDHSALIEDMECDLTKLRLKFLHLDALSAAENAWTMPKFVMMAFHEKCGRASKTGERDYLLVRKLKFDRKKLSVLADISHIGVVEAVGKENPITVDMGSYTPGSLNGAAGFDSQAGNTVATNGTVAAGNSTSSTSASEDFDVALDDKIGYTTFSPSANVVKRFTGLDEYDHRIVVRGWFSCGWCKKVVKAVVNVVKTVATKFIPSYTLTPLNKNINVNLGGGNVVTPFSGRRGYEMYSKTSGTNHLRLYCVDCGVSGVLNVKATVTFNLIGIITSGSFGVNGHMAAGLGLGVDATYAAAVPAFSKTIMAIPLSPFAIPGLITIGPHLDLGVGASASINAKGNMYAGIRLNWPAIHAQLYLYSAPSASGWIPSVVPEFQAQGTIVMGASVYATVSLGFGVSILNGLKSFGVALVEKPELYLGGTSTNPSCRGVRLSAGFKNTVYADVFGSHHTLNVWDPWSTSRCVIIKKRATIDAPKYPISKRAETKQIVTSDQSIGLHYADNGNIYALPQGNGSLVDMSTISFASTNDGILTGDVESRIFHGYVDTLASEGVSRLRLSRADHMPKTAVVITLQKSNTAENPDMLIALDAEHHVYYPVVCTFVGDKDFPKMFLAKDPDAGVNVLMDKENVGDITGAEVDACAFLPLVAN